MNNQNIEDIIKKAGERITLSASERAAMRASLSAYQASHPLPVPSPLASGWGLFARPTFALAAVLILVFGGGGAITYAAEGTLPGDIFYPIKVAIVEPLQAALIFSTSAHIAWEQTLAERRLTEAAVLAEQGRLVPATEAGLVVNFEQDINAAVVVASSSSDTTASITDTSFAARLLAYRSVLAQADTKEGTSSTALLRESIGVQAARYISASSTIAVSPEAAGKLQTAASTAVDSSASLIDSYRQSLDASSSLQAQSGYQDVATLSAKGTVLLKQHDTEGATRAFQSALSSAARLEVLTHAAASLNINAFATTTATTTSSTHHDSTTSSTPATTGATASTTGSGSGSVNTSSTNTSSESAPAPAISVPPVPVSKLPAVIPSIL